MNNITASNIIRAISKLPKNQAYNYVSFRTSTKVEIVEVVEPEGPIVIRRYDPNEGEGRNRSKREHISTQMVWRVANAIRPNQPINIDRILGASYNTRSAFEALLAHTPEFYYCYPGRIEVISSSKEVKRGHKHLMWCPDNPHPQGVMREKDTQIVISEVPSVDVIYEALILPEIEPDTQIDIEIARRHAQIQVALVEIGKQLGFRTWVAQNDKGIEYKNRKLAERDDVVGSLNDERLLASYNEAARAALLIDCIWFKNARFMPAVIEVEHSTGVTSGLSRMKNFQDVLPPYPTRWVIAAADEDRDKVMRECNKPQFHSLEAKFFPYSAVEELYSLCQRRKNELPRRKRTGYQNQNRANCSSLCNFR